MYTVGMEAKNRIKIRHENVVSEFLRTAGQRFVWGYNNEEETLDFYF